MTKEKAPPIVQLNAADLERLLAELRAALTPGTFQLVEALLLTLQWIMAVLEQKKTTIARLRRLIFGERTEKCRKIFPHAPPDISSTQSPKPKRKPKKHVRHPANDHLPPHPLNVPPPHSPPR